jgi:aryl sulfotransferase
MNEIQSKYSAAQGSENRRLVVKNYFIDSNNWNLFKHRKTDIVIASCYKSGTTLTQQIVNLLINGHDNFESIQELSPLVDSATIPLNIEQIENLPDPRFFKSHLPFDALPYYPDWKYIYLGRDGRDVGLSLHNHLQHRKALILESTNLPPKMDDGSDNFSEFWDRWVETGEPRWPFWEHINSWWQVRHLPNILLVHYANLINDKPGEIQRIANFLNLKLEPSQLDLVLSRSDLKYMKENWQKFQALRKFPFKDFLNKGTNGRWQDLLTTQQLRHYERVISQKLEPECANWVKNGGSLKLENQSMP